MAYEKLKCKFANIKYVRPNYENAKMEIKACIRAIRSAKTYSEVRDSFLKVQDIIVNIDTAASLCSIRSTLDKNDLFYENEDLENTKGYASLSLVLKKFNASLIESKFRDELASEFGELYIKQIINEQKLIDKSIVSDIVKENRLCQKYTKTVATCQTDFKGEECNFYGLLKHMEDDDRETRKDAFVLWANLYESVSDKLDDIYDKLVYLRVNKAKKLGFDSYTDYAYLSLNRFDYNKEDVKRFREQVKKYIVPVANKLYLEQKERTRIDKMHWYDEAYVFVDGNPMPKGNKNELVEKANEMYHKLSKETGEFFDFMVKHDLFDLDTRPGKHLGGYCSFLPKYKAPFIFSNFNGTSADVGVLTHEAGHAFQSFISSKHVALDSQVWSTYEICEIHSMSMELFTYHWMNKFFGKDAKKYRYAHLSECIKTIPYLVAVDDFQHRVYEKPEMTALERREEWKKIEKEYMPWRDYDGNKFLSDGGFWMQKQHIFLSPFYYIDYAIAQVCAFEFLIKSRINKAKAWKDYMKLCVLGGSKGYKDLLKEASLLDPLEDGVVKPIIDDIEKVLEEFKLELKTNKE